MASLLPRTLALLLASTSSPLLAADLYVSPTGTDAAPGTLAAPLSIHRAAEIAAPGDTVLLLGGTYTLTHPVTPKNSGTPDSPITYTAAPGQKPILDGINFVKTQDDKFPSQRNLGLFHLDNLSHIRVQFLHVRNSRYVNFMITGESSRDIHLIGCRAENSYGPGICLWRGENLKVLGCEVTGANDQLMRSPGQRTGSEAPHEALSLMQVKHVEIAFNRVHKCHKEGIDVKETASHVTVHHNEVYDLPRQGIYVDCWFGHLQDVEIYANAVHDCEWGIVISAEGKGASMSDIRIRHNVVYSNRASGIFFGRWGTDGPRQRIDIFNNTVFQNGSPDHWAGDVGGIDLRAQNVRDVRIVNNIVFNNHSFEIATFAPPESRDADLASRNILISNNLTGPFRSSATRPTTPPIAPRGGMFNPPHAFEGTNTLFADPLFLLWKAADFRLKEGSLALSAAAKFDGLDGGPNIGCAQP